MILYLIIIPIIAMIAADSLKTKHDSIKVLVWVLIVSLSYFIFGLLI
jgi:hypothetical protein